MTADIKSELREVLRKAGVNIEREVVNMLISPPKTALIYPLKGALHRSSAPGEAPANRTGNLIQSLYSVVKSANELEIGETARYAGYLEDGTSKMLPRPHLGVVARKYQRTIGRMVDDALKRTFPPE